MCRFSQNPDLVQITREAFDYSWCKLCHNYFWGPEGNAAVTIQEVQRAGVSGNIDKSFSHQIRIVEIYPTATLHERTVLQLDRLLKG